MEIVIFREGVSVSQRKYIIGLLTETCILGCRHTVTPIEFNVKLEDTCNKVSINRETYQRLMENVIYLSHTRHDILYVVISVSQFMQTPYEEHMETVSKILRYLKATPIKRWRFKKTDKRCIETYIYSDWANLLFIENPLWVLYFCVGQSRYLKK